MRIVCISDTHIQHRFTIPDGDVLIHAGDGTSKGNWREIATWFSWLALQPHRHKVVIAGDHDFMFEREPEAVQGLLPHGITYLQDSGIEIEGIKFWGSPWQPWFFDWAFNLPRGQRLAEKWAQIPDDTQVLITHGPPHGILDRLPGPKREKVGCEALLERIHTLPRLRLHIFGHIHHSYGKVQRNGVKFVNASICDERYRAAHAPIVVEL